MEGTATLSELRSMTKEEFAELIDLRSDGLSYMKGTALIDGEYLVWFTAAPMSDDIGLEYSVSISDDNGDEDPLDHTIVVYGPESSSADAIEMAMRDHVIPAIERMQ